MKELSSRIKDKINSRLFVPANRKTIALNTRATSGIFLNLIVYSTFPSAIVRTFHKDTSFIETEGKRFPITIIKQCFFPCDSERKINLMPQALTLKERPLWGQNDFARAEIPKNYAAGLETIITLYCTMKTGRDTRKRMALLNTILKQLAISPHGVVLFGTEGKVFSLL